MSQIQNGPPPTQDSLVYSDDISPKTMSPNQPPSMAQMTSSESLVAKAVSRLPSDIKENGKSRSSSNKNAASLQSSPTSDRSGYMNAEFPFTALPGTTGVLPTNDLVHRVDYAHSPEDRSTAKHTTPQDEIIPTISNGVPSVRSLEQGFNTPPRRSVQFARPGAADSLETPTLQKSEPKDAEGIDGNTKESHGSRLMSRLKSLTSPIPGHSRSLSGWTIGSADGDNLPAPTERRDDEDDADAEESGAETSGLPSSKRKSKRKARRQKQSSVLDGTRTAPTTPRGSTLRFPGFHRSSSERSPAPDPAAARPPITARQSTMSDIPEHHRLAFSEDEGHAGAQPRAKRPNGFRRITGIGSSSKSPGAEPTSPWKRGERMSTTSAVRWRQLKQGLKILSAKKKGEKSRLDHVKSAELMAELIAGAPAALLLASMFQRDEHGRKRIPVLLEQLKVKVTDSVSSKNEGGDARHLTFRIELEYASALVRMKWVINRTWRDFAKLHTKYKMQFKGDDLKHFRKDNLKLPKFPRRAVPYLRSYRGLYEDEENEEDDLTAGEQTAAEQTAAEQTAAEESGLDILDGDANGTDRPTASKRRSSINFMRRTASAFGPESLSRLGSSFVGASQTGGPDKTQRDHYNERVRKRLELYLQQLINCVIFRPISNRLCKFLELSALGIRLAPEGGYHGKEGFMLIKSTKGVDFRKKLSPRLFVDRHSPKWFLIRHSYIACVDSPDALKIYDVFLVDPHFKFEKKKNLSQEREEDENPIDLAKRVGNSAKNANHHQLTIKNTESVSKLLLKSERLTRQFEESIKFMLSQTEWSKLHRFGSFAPVRKDCWAQPLIDGQDYMWNVSRAIDNAREVIYIHDWWLTPEVYLRRPPAISQEWRLDRLLQKKADQGVKIFVIVYRNVESAIPISSEHTKACLVNLGPNVFIQRSPNQFRQNTFFWAHHEKVVVIDHTVAFCGGVDLCFGRWDTPQHNVCDDKLTGFEDGDFPRDSENCQIWPGKDYSNPRVQDFFGLEKPYDEMYDRTKVPRMPWHDVGMQIIGQPARDLSRHFVQRWNFLLRQRDSARPRPMLLPPPDFLPADLEALDLQGTCEVQILRSSCAWSLGTMDKHVECSIMTAYVESIRESEHLVYIENQFFITSCEAGDTKIENKIGDALVERIIRAHENEERWKAIIVIPLVPGFQSTVDIMDGTSVRLIMQLQFYSICRGEKSIFGRLQRQGIDPREYIEFYALRSWGAIGPEKTLVTEQLYIHAKVMVVDDRIAIIGSANINERSMLGSRDSEIAAIVRDTDMIQSRLAGQPYTVSRFAHTFRMKLMREHLGLDVCRNSHMNSKDDEPSHAAQREEHVLSERDASIILEDHISAAQDSILNAEREYQHSRRSSQLETSQFDGAAPTFTPAVLPPNPTLERHYTADLGLPQIFQLPALPPTDDTDIGGPPLYHSLAGTPLLDSYPFLADMQFPQVLDDCMVDPVADSFFHAVWHTVAENNTAIFRLVFRCMPDSEVRTWKEYKQYDSFYERFKGAQTGDMSKDAEKNAAMQDQSDTFATAPTHDSARTASAAGAAGGATMSEKFSSPTDSAQLEKNAAANAPPTTATSQTGSQTKRNTSKRTRKRAGTKGSVARMMVDVDDEAVMLERADAEELLKRVQGHLVVWPYDWLCSEMDSGNWNHPVDHMAPLEIYS
ncbi:phospholipase D [Microthyrium microscopicum]|uniref:Phospholipase n=1 Tax=Microthyrium microscopicum TaxID=703497 RepID=A0A6A6TVN4_9PEZI|nr:phospholipase D [Microthyrium microscopicum]